MELGINSGMHFYYPGYLALNTTIFDYKIFPTEEAIEVYIPEHQKWYSFIDFGKEGLIPFGFYLNFNFEDFINDIENN
jgi:hypothetical protein